MDTKPLITLAEAKAALSVRPEVTKDDARLTRLALLATLQIEFVTERYFTRQSFVEFLTTRDNQRTDYDFRGSADYAVPTFDVGGMRTIVTPASFQLDGVEIDPATLEAWYNPTSRGANDFGNDDKLVSEQDFQLDAENSSLHLYIATRFRLRALKVSYTAGYVAAPTEDKPDEITLSDSAPSYLKEACLIQTLFLNAKLRTDNIGMAAERTTSDKGKVGFSYWLKTNGLTSEVIPLIAHLKRARTGRG
jgi:hypothetical protein